MRARGALTIAGLVAEVIGTFLPWLRSGTSTRNSYALGGALRRLLAPSGVVDQLLGAWPALVALCAAAIASALIGGRVLPIVLSAAAAVAGAAAAVAALTARGEPYAQVVISGPLVTLIGATVVGLALVVRRLRLTPTSGT